MTFSPRRLLISALLGLLPLAAQAQGFAQDVFQPQRAAGGTATGATADQPAQPGVALPAIGNAAQQRQRTGRQAAQPFELIPQSLILPL
jgi:hypothetical protein